MFRGSVVGDVGGIKATDYARRGGMWAARGRDDEPIDEKMARLSKALLERSVSRHRDVQEQLGRLRLGDGWKTLRFRESPRPGCARTQSS